MFFSLEHTSHEKLFEVKDSKIGDQNIYAVMSKISLYANNVPYKNTNWVLCGFVPEDTIFSLGNKLYTSILTTIFFCAIMGIG